MKMEILLLMEIIDFQNQDNGRRNQQYNLAEDMLKHFSTPVMGAKTAKKRYAG